MPGTSLGDMPAIHEVFDRTLGRLRAIKRRLGFHRAIPIVPRERRQPVGPQSEGSDAEQLDQRRLAEIATALTGDKTRARISTVRKV